MKNYKPLFVLSFAVMLLLGIVDGMRGPLIPGFRSTFGIDYTSIGIMLFIASLGFVVATFFGGFLSDRFGQKRILVFGFIVMILGILGISYSKVFGIFLFMMGFLNIGMGMVDIGTNSMAAFIFTKNQAVFMNLLHFFYGLGASIGPWYSGRMISAGFKWNDIYFYSLIFAAVLLIYTAAVKPLEGRKHGHEEGIPLKNILKDRKALLFGTALGFYVACELGVGNWFVNYLTVVYKMSELQGAALLSLYFVTFTAGRLVGGFIAERMGYFNSIIVFMGAALIIFISGTLLGQQYVLLVSLCGLAFSIVYPTMTALVIGEFKKSTGSILGFVITMSSGINMFSNWLIGKINDSFGVDIGFMIIGLYIAIAIALLIRLRRMAAEDKKAATELASLQPK